MLAHCNDIVRSVSSKNLEYHINRLPSSIKFNNDISSEQGILYKI